MGTILSNFREVVSGKYAQFTGRASRGEFWKYVLVVFIINLIFTLLQNLLLYLFKPTTSLWVLTPSSC